MSGLVSTNERLSKDQKVRAMKMYIGILLLALDVNNEGESQHT